MAPRGSVAAQIFQWMMHFQFAAFLLCGVPMSQGQTAEFLLGEEVLDEDGFCLLQQNADLLPTLAGHVKTIPLNKQYVPVANKDGKTIAYKTAYFGEVHVGTPSQTFTVVFDTGSGHMILPRSSCATETCAKHRRYERADSTSAVDIKYNGELIDPQEATRDHVVISFGTGQVTGIFVQDTVCVGNADDIYTDPDCVKLRFVSALEMTPDPFSYFAFDGVMGLGLDALRLNPEFSFFGGMASQNPLMMPYFSVFLSRHEDGQSSITFGGHDEGRASSEIEWAPVAMAELGYWQVQIKEIRIGDTVLDYCEDGSCRAIVDTGTSLLGVPREAARTMHRFLARPAPLDVDPSQIDCRQVPGRSIDFDLGGTVVSLPVETYSRPAPINITNPSDNSSKLMCRSLLLPVDMAPPMGPKA